MIEKRIGHKGVGFGAAISSSHNKDTGELFEQVLPEDLIEYGLIPEFIGRLPVVAAIHQLTRDDLITILTEPRNALTRQFQRFFEFDDIELVFAEDSLGAISDKALERETGARGLRSILEETLIDVQFELPSRRDVSKCVVTKETIERGRKPTLVTQAAADEPVDEPSSRRSRPRPDARTSTPRPNIARRGRASAAPSSSRRPATTPPRSRGGSSSAGWRAATSIRRPRARPRRTSRSRSRRRTSPARCTWATR